MNLFVSVNASLIPHVGSQQYGEEAGFISTFTIQQQFDVSGVRFVANVLMQ